MTYLAITTGFLKNPETQETDTRMSKIMNNKNVLQLILNSQVVANLHSTKYVQIQYV